MILLRFSIILIFFSLWSSFCTLCLILLVSTQTSRNSGGFFIFCVRQCLQIYLLETSRKRKVCRFLFLTGIICSFLPFGWIGAASRNFFYWSLTSWEFLSSVQVESGDHDPAAAVRRRGDSRGRGHHCDGRRPGNLWTHLLASPTAGRVDMFHSPDFISYSVLLQSLNLWRVKSFSILILFI